MTGDVIFPPSCVAANTLHATNNFQIIPDFSLKDSVDQTVLGLALWTGTRQQIRHYPLYLFGVHGLYLDVLTRTICLFQACTP